MSKIKMFCLPYGGGSASVYLKWTKLTKSLEIIPVELAGRGSRIQDPQYTHIDEAVEDVCGYIMKHSDDSRFVIFGHSLGSLIAYELYFALKAQFAKPLMLFLSGKNPPDVLSRRLRHKLSDEELKRELHALGGLSEEVLLYPEILELFLPVIRNDFKIVEQYVMSSEHGQVDCPLVIFNGRQDRLTSLNKMERWHQFTTSKCEIHHYDGHHFFLFEQQYNIMKQVENLVSRYS
nr:thioesterase domain-containing protein [Evansella caseinilytica]